MQVTFKFYNPEIFAETPNGVREVDEGATIEQAMDAIREREGSFTTRNFTDFVIFLLNNAPANPDAVLADGDEVLVLRKSHGG